ncbi:MAG: glycosyltransferase family 4 protein [Crocinitomicaceae bacterium]|nr:glycosyltransferase family 4 protein [Crocinitomicaceae bacterium]
MDTKVLIDCHIFDQNFQGIRTFLKGLISVFISEQQFELILIAHDIESLQSEFGSSDKISYVKINSKNKYQRLAVEIPQIIKKTNATHALFNYTTPLIKVKRCQYLTVLHDVLFLDFPEYFPKKYRIIHKQLFKHSIRLSDHILTVSEYSRHRINHHFNLDLGSENVIPNAVDNIFYETEDKMESKKIVAEKFRVKEYILFVSRIETRKNHKLILDWYLTNKIYEKGIELIFVGKLVFNQINVLSKLKEAEQLSNNLFKHIHQVSNEDLFHLNNAARVVVFPSLCEGFGIPPLESAILKTPTICSNRTALQDFTFLQNHLVDPDSGEFLKKIEKFIFSPASESNELLTQIAEDIKSTYSWKKSASRLSKIISS